MLERLSLPMTITALAASVVFADPVFADPAVTDLGSHPWIPTSTETIEQRFPAPPGTTRLAANEGSFAAWLRALPVKPRGSEVHHFDGTVKPNKVHAAVIDLDVGTRDLQQCADAVMRLRAEYLRAAGCEEQVAFNFTSGDRAAWTAWAHGERPRIDGNRVSWSKRAAADESYKSFRRYLDTVFIYAGSASLERELDKVDDPSKIEAGDVFIQGGFPGHAVIVMDVAEDSRGQRRFLLAQSYMPAQDLHVLRRPGSESPWYDAQAAGALITPEWRFRFSDLQRFSAVDCQRDEPLHVGGDIVPPRRLHPGRIDHRAASGCEFRQTQFYLLQTVIDTNGEVESVNLLKEPSDACLADYLRGALDDWKFEPATLDGKPVRVYYNLSATLHVR